MAGGSPTAAITGFANVFSRLSVRLLLSLLVAALVAAAGWRLLMPGSAGLAPGQIAPPTEFRLVDGSVVRLAQLRGKPVMVDFWATTCAICVAEMPAIKAMQQDFAGRFTLLTVAMPYDRPDRVLDYRRRHYPDLPVALDPMGEIVSAWGPIEGTPTRFLIDADGRVAHQVVGAIEADRLRAMLARLIEAPA